MYSESFTLSSSRNVVDIVADVLIADFNDVLGVVVDAWEPT